LVLACGSDDSGGGAASADFEAKAKAACARAEQDACNPGSLCVEDYLDEYAVDRVFGCDAEHVTLVDCLGKYAWTCKPVGGGTQIETPPECDAAKSAYQACAPICSYSQIMDSCNSSCIVDGQTIGIDCPNGPGACTCEGPKAGTAVTAKACERGELAAVSMATCK
jgi:hypothetical protein